MLDPRSEPGLPGMVRYEIGNLSTAGCIFLHGHTELENSTRSDPHKLLMNHGLASHPNLRKWPLPCISNPGIVQFSLGTYLPRFPCVQEVQQNFYTVVGV